MSLECYGYENSSLMCGPPLVKLLVMQGPPHLAREKGEYTGKSDTPRSYTKLGAFDGDYLIGFSLIPP